MGLPERVEPAGPQGAQGPQGPPGLQGAPGVSGLERVDAFTPINSNSPKELNATCPAGKTPISAEYDILGGKTGVPPNTLLEVVVDQVATSANAGFLGAYETDPTNETWSLALTVLCARVDP